MDDYIKTSKIGKIVLYGIIISFASSIVMCVISLVLLVRTVNLANRVYERNEELNKRYELFEEKISEAESTIEEAEKNIEKNTLIMTTTIDGQTEFVNGLYESMLSQNHSGAAAGLQDKQEQNNKQAQDETAKNENSTAVSNGGNVYNELLDTELDILLKMLEKLSDI